jgi:elongation factor Tu
MTVEDVFAIRNRGTVATGRVESGALRVGDNIGVLFKDVEKSRLNRGSVLTSSSSAYGEAPPI